MKAISLVALIVPLVGFGSIPRALPQQDKPPTPAELIQQAIKDLVAMQEDGGQWPYEGVYRVKKELPIGYRVGGTALVGSTLLLAAPKDEQARAACERGLAFVLKELNDPLMAPSTANGYDVRVWGHTCALDFLCQVRAAKAAGSSAADVDGWIAKLVDTLVTEEIPGGGWNYGNRRQHASFVTAPVTQSLLLARSQGAKVPDEILDRARHALKTSRIDTGSFLYSGTLDKNEKAAKSSINLLPGSIARSAVCETTLRLLGDGSDEAVKGSIEAFHKYWSELEKRRKQPGTHVGDYKIAP